MVRTLCVLDGTAVCRWSRGRERVGFAFAVCGRFPDKQCNSPLSFTRLDRVLSAPRYFLSVTWLVWVWNKATPIGLRAAPCVRRQLSALGENRVDEAP